jgi:tetratricopeptide (TPR) repeat protein
MALLARAKSIADTKSAIRVAEQALALSRQLPDTRYTALVYTHLVFLRFVNSEMPLAQKAVDSALWYADKTSDRPIKGFALFRKGWLQDIQGNDHESMVTYLQALKYLEGTGAYIYQSFVYYNMAGNYAAWNDLVNEKKYAQLALQAARQSGDPDQLVLAYQAMASYYHYSYQKQLENKALLDSALVYNKKGIKFFSEHGDHIIIQSTLAIIALNTADLYDEYFPAKYKDTAWSYLQISLNASLKTRQLYVLSACYAMMSDYEIAKGNYKKTEELLLTGLAVFQSFGHTDPRSMAQFMDRLSKLYEKMGNPTAALKYYKEFYNQHQQLYDADKLAITNRLEAQYQSEKKDAALKTLRHTAALNKKLNYLYISLAIAAIIALLFIIRFFQVRLKATRHQQTLLENEKAAAALHARLKEEEAMRLMAEQQLLQERQERLQKELLAGSLQVEQKDELLQTLQKKIEEHKKGDTVLNQINQIIDQHKRIDDAQEAYKADLDNIRPEFFEKLKEKSANTLSRLDLKHCSYISLGLTNKEIAQRLGVAPKSILMARYRIKLKLGLGKEDDLDEYIATLK